MTRMPEPLDGAVRRRVVGPAGRTRDAERRAILVAGAVLAVQLSVLVLAEALRPPAAEVAPHAVWDAVAVLLSIAYLGSLVTALTTLERPRTSLRASGLAASGAALMTIGCPLSGHHTLGAWFATELALVGLGAAAVVAGLRRLR